MSVALLPAVEQLRLLRQRKLSALELAEEHIRRIEQINPVLNAFADFDVNRVRAQASNPLGGPLSGLPITIKSSIETAGHRCEIEADFVEAQLRRMMRKQCVVCARQVR